MGARKGETNRRGSKSVFVLLRSVLNRVEGVYVFESEMDAVTESIHLKRAGGTLRIFKNVPVVKATSNKKVQNVVEVKE